MCCGVCFFVGGLDVGGFSLVGWVRFVLFLYIKVCDLCRMNLKLRKRHRYITQSRC